MQAVTRARSGRYGLWHFLALSGVLLLTNVAGALYATANRTMPTGTSAVCYFLAAAVVYFWFMRFARDHELELPLDIGWFLYLAWWGIVPFYLFKVRGVKALWTILAVLGAYLATYGVSLLVFDAVV